MDAERPWTSPVFWGIVIFLPPVAAAWLLLLLLLAIKRRIQDSLSWAWLSQFWRSR